MKQDIQATHMTDRDGNPAGGRTLGVGIAVSWQDGPLGRGADRKEPNGAFVETVVDVAIDRLEFYQNSKFACAENAEALLHLNRAKAAMNRRTARREEKGIEGTHAEEPPPLAPLGVTSDRDALDTTILPSGQQRQYLVLSEEERAKGFVRPVRHAYKHLTCGVVTTMNQHIAETYARSPEFYAGTFCAGCGSHFPVGADGQFVWDPDDGTKVGT